MHTVLSIFCIHSRYHSIVGGQKVTWHMEGNVIQCLSGRGSTEARVLAEELAYNKSLQQFKIFILDRPLDPEYQVRLITHTHPYTHANLHTHTHTHTPCDHFHCETVFQLTCSKQYSYAHILHFLLTQPSSASSKVQDSLRVRRTFREQKDLLYSFHNYRQVGGVCCVL